MARHSGHSSFGHGSRGYQTDSGFSDDSSFASRQDRGDRDRPRPPPRTNFHPDDGYSSEEYGSSASRARAKTQRDEIKRLESSIDQYRLAQGRDRDRIKTLEEENKGLKDSNRALNKENGMLRDDGKRLKGHIRELSDENGVLSDGQRGLKEHIGTLSGENRDLIERNRTLIDNNRMLSDKIGDLDGRCRSMAQRLSDQESLKEKNRHLVQNYNSLEKEAIHLRIELKRCEQLVKSTEKELRREQLTRDERRETYKTKIENARRECDNFRERYKASEDHRAGLEQAKQALEKDLTNLQTACQTLHNKNADLNAQTHRLGEQNQILRSERGNLTTQIQTFQFSCQHLTRQLEEANHRLEEMGAELAKIDRARQGVKGNGDTTVRQRPNGKLESFRPRA